MDSNSNEATTSTKGMGKDYNSNSQVQLAAIKLTAPYIKRAVDELAIDTTSPIVIIADYGSSHGSNSMHAMQYIIQSLKEANKIIGGDKQQVLVVHNDLPTNDWLSLFNILNTCNSYNGVASGRSFYEQCLPSNSLSIGYSSTSLHWLSQKPCNLSDQCLVDCSRDDNETNAFKHQAASDYARFLEFRSRELLAGGVLILSILADSGKDTRDHANLLYKCAKEMLTPEELLEYTIPVYCRSYAECVDNELFAKYGLELIVADSLNIESNLGEQVRKGEITYDHLARVITMGVRMAFECPLKQALTSSGQRSTAEIERLLDRYWELHEKEMKETPSNLENDMFVINIVLKKIN